jgi:twitching motility protein PilT
MQIGQDKFGMQTMNQSLAGLYLRRMITMEDALARSSDHEELRNLINDGQREAAGGRHR